MKDFKTRLSYLFYYLGDFTSKVWLKTGSYTAYTLYCHFMSISVKLDVLGKVWFPDKERVSEEKT